MVPLLDRTGTAIDETTAFQITVGRLGVRTEVLNTELQPAQLNYVASLEPMIVQNRVLGRCLPVFRRLLRFKVPDNDEHHVGDTLRGFASVFRLSATSSSVHLL